MAQESDCSRRGAMKHGLTGNCLKISTEQIPFIDQKEIKCCLLFIILQHAWSQMLMTKAKELVPNSVQCVCMHPWVMT